jgi:hypothetical protein
MEPVLTAEQAMTYGGILILVAVIMGAFGKPLLRKVVGLPPKNSDQPEDPGKKATYKMAMNFVAVVLGWGLIVIANLALGNALSLEVVFNASLGGLFAGLAGTGGAELATNTVDKFKGV